MSKEAAILTEMEKLSPAECIEWLAEQHSEGDSYGSSVLARLEELDIHLLVEVFISGNVVDEAGFELQPGESLQAAVNELRETCYPHYEKHEFRWTAIADADDATKEILEVIHPLHD